MTPELKDKFTDWLAGAVAVVIIIGFFIWMFSHLIPEAVGTPQPQPIESKCLDGIAVEANGHLYDCVNGEQGPGQMWVPVEKGQRK